MNALSSLLNSITAVANTVTVTANAATNAVVVTSSAFNATMGSLETYVTKLEADSELSLKKTELKSQKEQEELIPLEVKAYTESRKKDLLSEYAQTKKELDGIKKLISDEEIKEFLSK